MTIATLGSVSPASDNQFSVSGRFTIRERQAHTCACLNQALSSYPFFGFSGQRTTAESLGIATPWPKDFLPEVEMVLIETVAYLFPNALFSRFKPLPDIAVVARQLILALHFNEVDYLSNEDFGGKTIIACCNSGDHIEFFQLHFDEIGVCAPKKVRDVTVLEPGTILALCE